MSKTECKCHCHHITRINDEWVSSMCSCSLEEKESKCEHCTQQKDAGLQEQRRKVEDILLIYKIGLDDLRNKEFVIDRVTDAMMELFTQVETQARQQALKEAEEGFLQWARDNQHDLGELGKFVRMEYLENYCKPDFPYKKPDKEIRANIEKRRIVKE